MRLWHEALIPHLPRQQLLGQHRECCALRGNGWGKKHSTVDYVFGQSPKSLTDYHMEIMDEMNNRGYNVDSLWRDPLYRGKECTPWIEDEWMGEERLKTNGMQIYPEHNHEYLEECLLNLQGKDIDLRGCIENGGKKNDE